MYLCYDIKGIQRFIFSIPKLKCVIGGSGLIAEFDHNAGKESRQDGVELIFAAGGRGAFFCASESVAEDFADKLIKAAHAFGLDIRIGVDESLTQASQHGNRLYPCQPEPSDPENPLAGEPCAISAAWPVVKSAQKKHLSDVHPLVRLRIQKAKEDNLGNDILDQLRQRDLVPDSIASRDLSFFRSVTPDADDYVDERAEAETGHIVLGQRNRWAIVAMDGNDMGRQFQAFDNLGKPVDATRRWLGTMSKALERCARSAFLSALGQTIAEWIDDVTNEDDEVLDDFLVETQDGTLSNRLVLPFRPLILGGDDIVMLCHSGYAMTFVQRMVREFREHSRYEAEAAGQETLWPATGGQLSISAGVLYCKVTFPLHLAIPYTESLLASAKGRFRVSADSGKPTPAAVDWDAITDTLVDTPAARRNRELRFLDPDLGNTEIQLTRRPYIIESHGSETEGDNQDLADVQELAKKLSPIPPSVRARILPSLQRPWSERVEFVASVAKRHGLIAELLWEDKNSLGKSWRQTDNNQPRTTGLPDALLLLEEEHRMKRAVDRS